MLDFHKELSTISSLLSTAREILHSSTVKEIDKVDDTKKWPKVLKNTPLSSVQTTQTSD
jgi:hypothetical protein